jgi:hypothetical protein
LLVVLELAVHVAQSNGMVEVVAWLFDQEFPDGVELAMRSWSL